NNITKEELYTWIREMGFDEEELDDDGFLKKEGVKLIKNYENNKEEIHIPNYDYSIPNNIKQVLEEKEWENPLSDYFRSLTFPKEITLPDGTKKIKEIKLLSLCD